MEVVTINWCKNIHIWENQYLICVSESEAESNFHIESIWWTKIFDWWKCLTILFMLSWTCTWWFGQFHDCPFMPPRRQSPLFRDDLSKRGINCGKSQELELEILTTLTRVFLWLDRSGFDILRLFTEQAFHCVATFPTFSNLRPTWCSILNIFQIKLLNLQRLQFYELGGKTIQALNRTYPWLELGQMHYFWKLSLNAKLFEATATSCKSVCWDKSHS